jgi:hypothetical protein
MGNLSIPSRAGTHRTILWGRNVHRRAMMILSDLG